MSFLRLTEGCQFIRTNIPLPSYTLINIRGEPRGRKNKDSAAFMKGKKQQPTGIAHEA